VGDSAEQVTKSISREANPAWHSSVMSFEVESRTDQLRIEVADLAGTDSPLHTCFLGDFEIDLPTIEMMGQRQENPGEAVTVTDFLRGTHHEAQISFDVLYEPYDTERPTRSEQKPRDRNRTMVPPAVANRAHGGNARQGGHMRQGGHAIQSGNMMQSGNMLQSVHSFRSDATSQPTHLTGTLSVRIIAAYDLVNTDSGILGDVSDPYVTLRLGSQSEKIRKRTATINNNLNPVWNTQPFLLPLQHEDDTLYLEVWDEDMMTSDDFLGRIVIPLYRIVMGEPNTAIRIRDRLTDTQHGELEVEIGFWPEE